MKNKYSKYLVYVALFILIAAGSIMYYFAGIFHPNIFSLVEMANNRDTVYCTLEKFTTTHKNGPSEQGFLVSSYNINSKQLIVNQKVKFENLPNAPTFLGYSNGFVWFNRNEKLVLVYLFKKDSVLEEEVITQLLNSKNPGMSLANITYAPTRGVIYGQMTSGDEFVINPYTFGYVSVRSELESYKYALLPNTRISGSGDRINVDSLELVFMDSKIASNQKKHIEIEVYSAKGNSYNIVFEDAISKKNSEFINPKFILYQNCIALIEHQSQIGDSAQLLITAIDTKKTKVVWQKQANALFQAQEVRDIKAFPSLNSSCFYLTTDGELPIKLDLKTGNIKKRST